MPKCKVCGSRVQEGAIKCPMCGVGIAGAQSQPTAPQKPAAQKPNPAPVQPQPQQHPTPSQPSQRPQQPNSSYTPPSQNNEGCFSKIIRIAITLIIIVVILLFIRNGCDARQTVYDAAGGSSSGTSYSQPQQQKSAYAKIDCEFTGKAEDFEWNLWGLNFALQMNVLEQHELTQADKNAIRYAINYIEKNMQPLENKGVYMVTLYKDYYNEHDKNGWFMTLRYNRTIEDFDALIARF